jgi:trk system potassium uptake protein TrkH
MRLRDMPMLVTLLAAAGFLMLVPAAHGFATGDDRSGRAFLYSGLIVLVLSAMLALATANRRPRNVVRSQLAALALAYLVVPIAAMLPFSVAVPDTRLLNAWFEMVACFTTTGGTLYDTPGRLPMSVHLWRGIVAWGGGYFVLVVAAAILAPLNLGGYEVLAPAAAAQDRMARGPAGARVDPAARVVAVARLLLPAYAGITFVLWVALIMAGEGAAVALIHAMGTISTSGISPVLGLEGGTAGFAGEAVVLGGLAFAVTRRLMPGAPPGLWGGTRAGPVWTDPEVRLAAVLVAGVTLALFARHWLGAIESEMPDDLVSAGRALWGAAFTVVSFLTTTGYESAGWTDARLWSGLETPGLILLGLAIMGGGVATTAGGVRLLRVYALYRHARRELERIAHPSSVGGGGAQARTLRREGAYLAFVTFMLFALSLGMLTALLAAAGVGFERSVVLAIAALTTTGPLSEIALAGGEGFQRLGDLAKVALAGGMVLGRLEMLALLALLAPGVWRD